MSKQDRLTWVSKGSPYRLMQPAADLRDVLRKHGYTVYDQGNRQHLEAEPPEDHTPYSETGYPGKAKYGVGYADDIMPPKPGQRSKIDGLPLPTLQQLGAQLLADRKANVPGIRWLKYMNWEPQANNSGPCYQESWKPTYARRSSTDRGHIHLSGLTGYETSTIGRGYDPVARIRRGGGDDMAGLDDKYDWGTSVRDAIGDLWWATFKGNVLSVEQRALARLEAQLAGVSTLLERVVALPGGVPLSQEQLAALTAEVRAAAAGAVDELGERMAEADRARAAALDATPGEPS